MRRLFCVAAISLLFAACTSKQNKEVVAVKKPFNDFLDAYYEERLRLFPMEATQIGDNRYNNLLPNDISKDFRSQLKDLYTRSRSELDRYQRDSLTSQEQ